MVVTSAEAIDGDTVDLRAQLTVKGTTAPLPLRTKVAVLDDGAVRLTAQATIDRKDFGVDGNMMGMIADKATISGDVVFRRADSIWRMTQPSRPLRILVYSDNPRTREQVRLALGKRVHPELARADLPRGGHRPMVITTDG